MLKTHRLSTAVIATVATASALNPTATASTATDAYTCVKAKNVWVVVEDNDPTTPEGGCATTFTNGIEALKSAGFILETTNSSSFGEMVIGINGVKPNYEKDKTFWQYSSGTVAEDLTISYQSYQVGASSSTPQPGSVEAWVESDGQTPVKFTALEKPKDTSSSTQEQARPIAIAVGIIAALGGIIAAIVGYLNSIGQLTLPALPKLI